MLTSKQRAFLRKQANGLDPIFQIGKGGITDEVITQLALALESRELIKVHILETALLDAKEAINEVAKRLKAEPVQAIGSKIVIYKRANKEKNRKIELPKNK
ncbi:MAG: ribosome assembly RNA-binding protein YhbY [Clostridia bacterium]|nr:ribosome assembly RNA-binding protein YhbY [Clostridia bacterium]